MLTNPIFFDTDCLSSFFWVKQETLLHMIYPGRLVVPYETYSELSKVSHLREQADAMVGKRQLHIESLLVDSEEFALFNRLTTPQKGQIVIGNGEAACIALTITNKGTFASNNMRDVACYVIKYGLAHITTASILREAFVRQVITEQQGNGMWKAMLAKRRKLPEATFSAYLANH